VEFTCARNSGELLLNCGDAAGQYLLRYRPGDGRTIHVGHICGEQDYIRRAIWSNGGSSYAFLTNDAAGAAFCIKTADVAAPVTVPWQGGVLSFTLNGGQLFFSGNPSDRVPGIWRYDLRSSVFTCVVSNASELIKYGIGMPPSCGVMTNSLGEQRFYRLWAPPHVQPGGKYPILLAQEHNTWFPYFQAAPYSGYYVAVVDRPFSHTWNGRHERTWVEDIDRLSEIMARHPNIDTNHVYLYACSAETALLAGRLADEGRVPPSGVVLFSPTVLPDVALLRDKRVLVVDGKLDGNAAERLSEFQDRAAMEGSVVTLYLQDAAGHMPDSARTEQERLSLFARFLRAGR
jgi:hypothetical protein